MLFLNHKDGYPKTFLPQPRISKGFVS